jgi:hypothetical protein
VLAAADTEYRMTVAGASSGIEAVRMNNPSGCSFVGTPTITTPVTIEVP